MYWWQIGDMLEYVNRTLRHVNSARTSSVHVNVAMCRSLFDALNQTWTAFSDFQERWGDSDNQSFIKLISEGMNEARIREFLQSEELLNLAEFKPHIMNHDVLRRRRYRPGTEIDHRLKRDANEAHRKLENGYEKHKQAPSDDTAKALLKKTAELLYVVRSNIAHAEKIALPKPDSDEAKRDDEVARTIIPVQLEILNSIFDKPDHKLIVYGILAPSAPGEYILQEVEGDWEQCKVTGSILAHEGLKYYKEYPVTDEIDCHLFSSENLPGRWTSIDAFEGSNYSRILIPAKVEDRWIVANVYKGRVNEDGL